MIKRIQTLKKGHICSIILVLKKITQFGAAPPEFRCKFPGAYEQEFQGLRCLDGNRCSYHYSREVLYMFPSYKCGSTVYRPQRNLGMKLKPNWTSRGGVRKDFSGSHALIGIVLKVLKTKFRRRLPITHYQLSGTRIHMFSVHDEDRPWVNSSAHFERSNGGIHCSKKMQPGIMLWYPMVCYGTLWCAHVFTSRVTTSSRVPSLENQSTMAINSLSMLENKTHLKVKINCLVVPKISSIICAVWSAHGIPIDLLDPNPNDKFLVRIPGHFCGFLALARSNYSTPHHHHQILSHTSFRWDSPTL